LKDTLALDGVVTLVDAKHLLNSLKKRIVFFLSLRYRGVSIAFYILATTPNELNEAYEQIAVADRILINKIDLVQPQVAGGTDTICGPTLMISLGGF
jgi:G3E family GTPase